MASFIEAIDNAVLGSLREKVDVRYVPFESSASPVSDSQSPGAAIRKFLLNPAAAKAKTRQETPDQDVPTESSAVTDISAALEQAKRYMREQPLAAVFLLSDVAHNQTAGRDPRQVSAELSGAPVYIAPIGATRRVRDIDLKAVSAPGVVMKDDDVVIEATLQAFDCAGETLRVELLANGEVIQDREVEVDTETATRRVRFNTQLQDVGPRRFQVRVVPLEGELSEENNFTQFDVNGARNHIDVLLADETPRWEYRYLAQLFRRDAKVACDELLFRPRLIATGRREKTKAFPATADEWSQYDVVLLGDVATQRLSPAAQESLAEFMRMRGGTLVVIAGDEFMPQAYVNQPLEALLPVTKAGETRLQEHSEGYAFHVTEEGWRHDALMIADTETSTRIAWDFINRNSPLHSLSPFRQARPAARTLISAVPADSLDPNKNPDQNALLCWQPVGRGRIVYLASPETYRLRFLHGDRLHYRFWGQLLRWAIAEDLATGSEVVNIRTDRAAYRQGESVQVTVRLQDAAGNPIAGAAPEAVATGAGETRVSVPLREDDNAPGRYVGAVDRLPSGVFRVEPVGEEIDRLLGAKGQRPAEPATATASFMVRAPLNREQLDTRSDLALAKQIADATGGQVLPPTAVSEVLALTDLAPRVTQKTDTSPLWVRWEFLGVICGCLLCEWVVRKRMGLS